jgi:hypothetical protein
MPDPMSFAEQHVELLPARTVLSLWHAGTVGKAGSPGEPGTPGANGESIPGSTWWWLFGYNRSGSGFSLGDASSRPS